MNLQADAAPDFPVPLATLRPRTLWDILDDAFDMYRQRFTLFAGAASAVYVPAYIVYILVFRGVVERYANLDRVSDPSGVLAPLFAGLAVSVPLLGVSYVLQSGITTGIVDALMHAREIDMKTALRQTVRVFWPLLLSSFLVSIMVTFGLCAIYIGALLVLALYAFTPQAVVLERRGGASAMGRSRDLCRTGFGSSLGLIVVVFVVTSLLSGGISGLAEIVIHFVPFGGDVAAQEGQKFVLRQSLGAIVNILLAPILGISTTLLYYDLRVRREGLDIVAQAESVGVTLAPEPFADKRR